MKILILDIETAPSLAYVWGMFKQNISIDKLVDTSYTMCWAAKWLGDDDVFVSSLGDFDREGMILEIWNLLNEADAVVTYNGNNFDLPVLNREFLEEGLNPPAPYKSIDLYQVVKSQFRFTSNKLDHVASRLGCSLKAKHTGFELWKKCMENDMDAWFDMEQYNAQDVRVTEEVYLKLIPWIKSHPNYALYTDTNRPVCTNCGSSNIQRRGSYETATQKYKRYVCNDCGTWCRERFTAVDKEKRKTILTQSR